jgi:hypothetical protein
MSESESYEDFWYRFKKAYIAMAKEMTGGQGGSHGGKSLPDFEKLMGQFKEARFSDALLEVLDGWYNQNMANLPAAMDTKFE